ncbi:MAG: DUF1553 domain-containing protein [Planctomycetota bacterium]|nr:MAG: DUF1553 domain-containing protein [Planctomycetota bacterium]
MFTRSTLLRLGFTTLLIGAWAHAATADETIKLLPGEFTLSGPAARQSLVLESFEGDNATGQLVEGLEFESSDPAVVKVEDGVALPVANGTATITATAGEKSAAAEVTVVAMGEPFGWSFRNHVEPVLSKAACNTGACHGALAGKKGFKLSLGAFDPSSDYFYITRQARARRVVLSDPGRSLLLEKPTGAVPHKGGVRFSPDSLEYRVLAEWIAAGAPGPQEDDARIERLEFLPKASVLEPGSQQQLIVLAHFDDGRAEDVTHWARFTSTNESVATVDDQGLVQVAGHGEAAIKAWYLSQNVMATTSVAYPQQVDPSVFAEAPRRNFIDELVLEKLENLNLPPSPPAGDAEFLRRAFVDTIGALPTIEETEAFLADESPEKRDTLIESLLERPEFVDYWAYKWSDLLLVNSEKLPAPAMWAYYHWIRNNVAANTPWDQFARELVTASGSTLENGAANFFVLHQDPPDLAETVSVAFLGMSINCAKCHNHPLEKWTNDQYYGMANLFARVRSKEADGTGNRVVYPVTSGEWIQPRTGKPQPPRPLDGEAVPMEAEADRRVHLADWLTSPENPYFSRAITNRVWANFFGVGLVESVDDLRLTNPPSNAALFDAAAGYLVEHDFDVKALMRVILQSATYARSSKPLEGNAADERFYSRYYPRRMMAEVLLDALSQVSGADTPFKGYAPGTRAIELPDVNVDSYFLKSFGRPERSITCECERTAMPSMVQVLHISNGDTLNQKLAAEGHRLEQMLADGMSNEEIIDEAYLAALVRRPTDEEKAKLLAALDDAQAERRQLIEDLYWSILSSKEFLFNH